MPTPPSRPFVALLISIAILTAPRSGSAATSAQIEVMISGGKTFLYDQQGPDGTWEVVAQRDEKIERGDDVRGSQWGGRTALCVYTLLASGESPQEPKLQKAIAFLKTARIVGTYALGVRMQAMLFLPQAPDVKAVVKRDAEALLGMMKTKEPGTGFYDYDGTRGSSYYSLSRSQYAVLGVWAAAQMGVEIPEGYWRTVETAWLRAQEADGGWAYQKAKYPTTPGITAVGVATLYIAQEFLAAEPGSRCRGNVESSAIDQGLKYMEAHAAQFATDEKYERDFPYATLYAVERIGVASGRKYFGKFDWFQKGADWLLTKQAKSGGFTIGIDQGPIPSTCFAMLFLSRGRAPVLMNKLEYTSLGAKQAEWNQRPRDVANLSRWVGRVLERDINWQVVSLDAPAAELHDAPILYVSGTNEIKLDDAAVAKLRGFAEGGGLIVGHADCGGRAFATSFKALAAKLFPTYEFRELPEKHPIYESAFSRSKWKQKPSVLGLSNGARELMILVPQADPGRAWQAQSTKTRGEMFELGANLFLYVADRKNLRFRGETTWVEADPKITPANSLAVNRLQYSGNWDPEPGGWRRLSAIVHNQNRATLTVAPVTPGRDAMTAPIAHLTGTLPLKLSPEARVAIKKYVDGGGTLVVDAAGGSPDFATSAELELAAIFPGAKPEVLPPNHAVFAAGGGKAEAFAYRRLAREKVVGKSTAPRLQGITLGNRVGVFFSREDLSAGLTGTAIDSIIGYEPASAVAIMTDILVYAAKLPSPAGATAAPPRAASSQPAPGPPSGPTTRPRTIPRKRAAG